MRVLMSAAFVASTLFTTTAYADVESETASLDVGIEAPAKAMVGDSVRVVLSAVMPKGDSLAFPEQSFDPFELLDRSQTTTVTEDGRQMLEFTIELLALETGEHDIGPVSLRYTTKDGELSDKQTKSASIEITSQLANEPNAELINEPTSPISIEQDDYTLLWLLAAFLAMALGGVLTWLFARWRKKRLARPVALPPPPPPPWEGALRKLRELEQARATMFGEGQIDPWVDSVNDSIREYLGKRFAFDGLECTSDEILAAVRDLPKKGIEDTALAVFLSDCDLVKFANAPLAEDASKELIADAFSIVTKTRLSIRPEKATEATT